MFTEFGIGSARILRRSALEREMRDEMQLHLDRQTDLLVARGMTRTDARLAARREFGNVGVHQEDARDARPARWIDSVGADIRFAFRFFARKPLSSATIVLVLAFGIAGYAALFGFVQSAILRPPPGVPRDVPLVLVRGMVRQKEQPWWSPMRFSYPALREMSDAAHDLLRRHGVDGEQRRRRRARRAGSRGDAGALRHRRLLLHPRLASSARFRLSGDGSGRPGGVAARWP